MLGAIYTGLSGMNAYSEGLQLISNNVANLNTAGYKGGTVSFNDLFFGGGEFLGSNYLGAGYGVSLNSPMIDFSQGTLQQTGNALDLAIQGNGFITVMNNGATYYLRTGSFQVGQNGTITDQLGDELCVLGSDNQPEAVNLSSMQQNPAQASTTITFANNLSSDATSDTVSSITVYDSQGGAHTWTANFAPTTPNGDGATSAWTVTVTDENGNTVGTGTIQFNGSTVDPTMDTVTASATYTGAQPLNVTLNFSQVTSYAGGTSSTLSVGSVDGNAMGTLSNVTVNKNGQIELTYSNGQTETAGTIALANFEDPELLQRAGNGLFAAPAGVEAQMLASGASGMGTLESGEIEASNVNLSNEFGQLILIERGYQACSQVVSIANEMIQTLFGIQGQA